MIKVKVSTSFPNWPLIRQTPGRSGIWHDHQFFINQRVDNCDYWVVFGGLSQTEYTHCPQNNLIFITSEPPEIKKYNSGFLKQFQTVISTSEHLINHPGITSYQQALPWMIGRKYNFTHKRWESQYSKDYDELTQDIKFEKKKLLSVIISDKSKTTLHKKRIDFVQKLKKHLDIPVDVYGRGFFEIADKWDAIADYQYHLVIENSNIKDYWTEKLADAFLCEAYPFYYGCTNIFDYFAKDTLSLIDIDNIEKSVEIIQTAIHKNKFSKNLNKIKMAKKDVLNKYNFFSMIVPFLKQTQTKKMKTKIVPEHFYTSNNPFKRMVKYIK
ncbi:MAG: glycosyltransferase family 10 [Spirochaetes bacterium]|nr:glycosyltransferase family 10 [Spirochaetota bacterium]